MVRTSKLVITLAAFGLFSVACSKDDTVPAARLSNLGESCRSSGDCVGAYVCVGTTCSVANTGISPTSNQCVLLQCTTAADCCSPQVSATQCDTYNTACQAATDPTTSFDCEEYNALCCPQAAIDKLACTNNVCHSICAADTDCTALGIARPYCFSQACVQCTTNAQCTQTGYVCSKDNTCVPSCTARADCPAFNDCQNNYCQYVGCANDRECEVAKGSAQAYCDSNKVCQVGSCSSDSTCFHPQTSAAAPITTGTNIYAYQVCVSGRCQNAGCGTDDECKAFLANDIATSNNPHATAACKAK
jgi:hypothetical protein